MFIAWQLYRSDASDSMGYLLEDGTEYEGKIRVARYDYKVDEEQLQFYKEYRSYFGSAAAIAYGDWGTEQSSSIYLGGATDNSKHANTSEIEEWAPFVSHLSHDLTQQQIFKMQIGWSFGTRIEHAQVDNLKLLRGTSNDYLFGTTRTD